LLACCDIKLRLKKELSFGHYETISKPLGSKPLNINFFSTETKNIFRFDRVVLCLMSSDKCGFYGFGGVAREYFGAPHMTDTW